MKLGQERDFFKITTTQHELMKTRTIIVHRSVDSIIIVIYFQLIDGQLERHKDERTRQYHIEESYHILN